MRCEIQGPIILVSAYGFIPKLDDRLGGRITSRPTVQHVANALNQMTPPGVPTILETERSKQYGQQEVLYFCTPQFLVRCILKEDVYLFVELRAPSDLYRLPNWRAIRVCPSRWEVYSRGGYNTRFGYAASVRRIKEHYQVHQEALARSLAREEEALTSKHLAYLELLRDHIALIRQVEENRVSNSETMAYTRVEATDAERVVRDTYLLRMEKSVPWTKGDFVWVSMEGFNPQGLRERARVLAVDGQWLKIKFQRQLDVARLPCPGIVGQEFDDVQQRVQEQALEAIQSNRSLNPFLLKFIVDGQYCSYPFPQDIRTGPLNPSQNQALHCAQSVKDVFLILGPPGTGKTHTITVLVQELAKQQRKALVTSKNNLAVDNVLVQINGLRVIRLGHEEAVSPEARHLLIDEQARALQQEILALTETPLQELQQALARRDQARKIIAHLHEIMPPWYTCFQKRELACQALRAEQNVVWKDFEPRLRRQLAEITRQHRRAVHYLKRSDYITNLLLQVLKFSRWPIIGTIGIAICDWVYRWAARARRRALVERATFMENVQRYTEETARYQQTAWATPAILQLKKQIRQHEEQMQTFIRLAYEGSLQFQALFTPDPMPLPAADTTSPDAFALYLKEIESWLEVLEQRYSLLKEWRDKLTERRQALYPTLVRSADVVGATCIGIATDVRFRDLEFDTVIADEAGQIQVFDLLVPLVRARRAVLVGDHKQLPPVVDDEVRALLDEDDEESIALFEQSLFERLFEVAPETHKVMLDTQYRMPAVIADFVSQAFYNGQYHTAESRDTEYHDPFFSSPFCFIDTNHAERYREARGGNEQRGYRNPGEATVLAALADAYLKRGYSVGVIVPYRLQVSEVQRALRRRCSNLGESDLCELVATVDSFQGKERDTILFGFTRSNDWGGVGFLRELRRLNVTITRARRQLVLLGDSLTLTKANDLPFRELAQMLVAYAKEHGQYLTVGKVKEILRETGC